MLKSKVQRLAETKGEEKMRQERLKGELKGLQRLQPEYPLAVQPEYPIAVQPEYPLAVPPQMSVSFLTVAVSYDDCCFV